LEKRAKHVVPGSKRGWGRRRRARGQGEEVAQTMYMHMNKQLIN
jgi:hypothetical protein